MGGGRGGGGVGNAEHSDNDILISSIDHDLKKLLRKKLLMQEFIDKQFLVSGHAIQFGYFVLVTSVEPLRAYLFAPEAKNRVAQRPLYPINANDSDTYLTDGVPQDFSLYDVRLNTFLYMCSSFLLSSHSPLTWLTLFRSPYIHRHLTGSRLTRNTTAIKLTKF